ncbi:MAG: DUF177 domain-containing protein [Bacteroidetes bacterium]|nr:MAG: DUF177 domain-containing protein [Bacteroidota bacterium]
MAGSDKLYHIPFVGLKVGKHQFEYKIEDSFFESMPHAPLESVDMEVKLELEKKETMLLAAFELKGNGLTTCDRCNGEMELELEGTLNLIYKFGLEESDDENLIVLHPDEYQIDVREAIYELILVSMPARKIHPEGDCDEEMWELIRKYTVNAEEEEEEIDEDQDEEDGEDPWSILKNLN